MTLHINEDDNLFGAHVTMAGFLPKDDSMVVFSKEIFPLFNDEDFKNCYSDIGRGAKSPSFLSMVTLLQFCENLSDEEATEACVRRIDWKIALHLPVDEKQSFDSSTLCRFRKRLKENKESSLIFDKILEKIRKKGYIKKTTNQRIDATHIISHVNRISTTDLLFRAVKCLLEEIEEIDKEYYERHIPELLKERYLNKFSSFGMSKDLRYDKQAEIVEDGYLIKSILERVKSNKLKNIKQLQIMETIFNENVVVKKKCIDNKEIIEVEEKERPKQSIFDPRDLSLQLGKKGKTSWVGSKCHIVETAEKGKINFLTGMIYQKAQESDQKIHDKVIESNYKRNFEPRKIYTDQNYISGESIYRYKENGGQLIGRITSDNSKKDEEFKLCKFEIDMKRITATCPMGKKSIKSSTRKDGSHDISFSKDDCLSCINLKKCVGTCSKNRRTINVNPYYNYIKERRVFQETERFKKEMSVRAQVEGTISEMVRKNGLRKAKYHGEEGHQFQFYLTGAALNLKRYIRARTKGRKIKTAA